MILKQRKLHLYSWALIAVSIPVLFLLAWRVVPDSKVEIPMDVAEQVSVTHSGAKDGNTLEVTIRKPLAAPGSLVLLGKEGLSNPGDGILIGQVHGMGSYKFQLPDPQLIPSSSYVLIYNPFTKVITHRFPL